MLDRRLIDKLKLKLHETASKTCDDEDDREIVLHIIKNIDRMTREEMTERVDLISEGSWQFKYMIYKFWLLIHSEEVIKCEKTG